MEDILAKELKNFESTILESLQSHETNIIKHVNHLTSERGFTGIEETPTTRAHIFEGAEVWQNWAGNRKAKPNKILYPKTVEDLKNYVKAAQKDGKKIRCAAEGHSWSSLSVTEGHLVIVNKLDKIDVEKRGDEWTVNAEAGAQISQIDKVLRKHDPPLTIESMTVLNNVTIGGVVSTGSHGAKFESRTIVDQVVGLQIVAADGNLHEFSNEKNREEMDAARLSLGLLGIIYRVSLRVRPMYNLRMIDTFPPRSWLTASTLKGLVEISDGIQLFYWPFNTHSKDTDRFWLKQWTESNDPVTLSDLQLTFNRVAQNVTTELANGFYQKLLTAPETTRVVTYMAGKLKLIERNDVLKAPDAIHYQAGVSNIPCEDMEFAIKADKDFKNVVEEIDHVINKIYEYADEFNYPINLVLEMRILKSSSATMSNAYDKDPEAIYFFIEVLSIKDTPLFEEFSIELAQRWIDKYNAIPHWGKSWEYVPKITDYLHKLLSERVKRFEAVRVKYDPNNLFFDNKSLQEVFYGTN